MNDEDEWINAIAAIAGIRDQKHDQEGCDSSGNPVYEKIGIPVYNPKPLAELLRGDKPISAESRHMLADFIDPPETATTNMRLVPRPIVTARKEYEFFGEEIPAVLAYEARHKEGVAYKEAIEKACETLELDEPSSFHKIRRKVLAYLAWIRGA